ncbi:MAG TPA: hypothetical protein P5524_02245 [Candidatus Paceibacterota bacterium]|nr:hypothetical protein [Candidatus Paceibacterota bacterium]
MHELEKIEEAKYFYSQMSREANNREGLKHNLSAFLSSARSVLQYALKEAQTKKGGQEWYDLQVSDNDAISFFTDKRDINIHAEPVSIRQDIELELTETIYISESARVAIEDPEGSVRESDNSDFKKAKQRVDLRPVTKTKYRFNDWIGDEDIFILCQKYLDELEIIVADGKKKGFLS